MPEGLSCYLVFVFLSFIPQMSIVLSPCRDYYSFCFHSLSLLPFGAELMKCVLSCTCIFCFAELGTAVAYHLAIWSPLSGSLEGRKGNHFSHSRKHYPRHKEPTPFQRLAIFLLRSRRLFCGLFVVVARLCRLWF
jgi:hypothetical protein